MDLFREGIRHFNKKRYYEAHEAWEKLWTVAGDEKKFLQGLIQIAAGYHHYLDNNMEGAILMLERGTGYISQYNACFDVNIKLLASNVKRTIASIKENREVQFPTVDFV
jgi:uncharacterized protein